MPNCVTNGRRGEAFNLKQARENVGPLENAGKYWGGGTRGKTVVGGKVAAGQTHYFVLCPLRSQAKALITGDL